MKKLLLLSICLLGIGVAHADFKFMNALPYPIRFNWDMDINEHHENNLQPGGTYEHRNWGRGIRKATLSVDYMGEGNYIRAGEWTGFIAPNAIILAYFETNEQGAVTPKLSVARY